MADETVDTLETLHGNASTAFDAYKEDPTEETEASYREAMTKVGEYKAPEPVKPQAPEKYDLVLVDDSPLPSSRLDEIATASREQGLSNEDTQKRVTEDENLITTFLETKENAASETMEKWDAEIAGDPELGGEHLNETKELTRRVADKLGNEGLAEMLKLSHLDRHPDWVRFTNKIGKMLADDKFFNAKEQQSGDQKSNEELFYGKVDQPAQ